MRPALATAIVVGIVAFTLYHATLLPGLDLGDTASLQVSVGSSVITPRDAYPLYFALGNLVLVVVGGDPAHALNLASALEGAVACGLFVLVAAELAGSVAAAAAAALLFAVSYTFWSQAIIAEVYALHLLFIGLTLWLALRWAKHPTMGRLTWLFAVYALGFGNHLSMILLAPGLTLFLLTAAPGGWRAMITPRVIGVAAGCAAVGALQYAWNFRALWLQPVPPPTIWAALQQFWFDVTKSDWRDTMVMNVPQVMFDDHASMFVFDVKQQFGWVGPLLAVIGLARIAWTAWRRAAFLFALYVVNAAFAFTYNVGDTHVFYLPSHVIMALLVAPGLVVLGTAIRQPHLPAALLAAYAVTRGWQDYPALDRSQDHRPTEVLTGLTRGLSDRQDLLLTDLDWQLQNGLTYFAKRTAPPIAFARMTDVLLYAPELIASNTAINRDIVLTETARATLAAAYAPLFDVERDSRASAPPFSAAIDVPVGTRYVLCLLKPTPDLRMDWDEIGHALATLTGGRSVSVPDGDYIAIAGLQGQAPSLVLGANRPFSRAVILGDVSVEIRMESWLNTDTIRRMGYGQVVAGHRHTLIVERGASFVAFDAGGAPLRTAYASSLFAPLTRYLIRR